MLFQRKLRTAFDDVAYMDIECSAEEAQKAIESNFNSMPEAAIMEELIMSDGRLCFTVKDRHRLILFQLKQIN